MTHVVAVICQGSLSTLGVLAAEALKTAAQQAGVQFAVEVHQQSGALTGALQADQIASADVVLIVGDASVGDQARFAGKRCVSTTVGQVLDNAGLVLSQALSGDGSGVPSASAVGSSAPPAGGRKLLVGITSCPTGIAHTFMAAEALVQSGQAAGYEVRIETQGSVGAQDTLSADEIACADAVIIAADTQVNLSRFVGKKLFKGATKDAINGGVPFIEKAVAAAQVFEGDDADEASGKGLADAVDAGKAQRKAQAAGVYKHLMTGVSFMLPFVTAGGILIALAFALGGIYVKDPSNAGTLGYALFQIGANGAFTLMVPALAGYIAYSIADRPGITPGMTGGMLAMSIKAGFLGGLAAGFIAGYVTYLLARYIKLPRNLEGLKPVLILPVLATMITGLLMYFVVGGPVAEVLAWLTAWLKSMQTGSAILLGLVLGAMMAFDMGGPVNKAAYAFSTGLISSEVYMPMAAAMAAGMTPPLGLALATKLFRDRFVPDEREAGNAAAVLGISFITEGAIPFAARDPMRVIPALVVGSAVAGGLSMFFGSQLKVPHGGIFVLPIPNAVTHLVGYVIAILAGTVVTALMLRLLKKKALA